MKNTITLLLFLCMTVGLRAADYYWVGGGGSWSDINHWATTSGGTVKHAIVPSASDDVYFDANSGITNGAIISYPIGGNAYCRNMSWAGVTATASFRNAGTYWLYVYGNLELAASIQYGWHRLQFSGNSNATFKTNGAARVNAAGWYNPITITKPGGSLTLIDDLPAPLAMTGITLTDGILDMSNGNHSIGGGINTNFNTARTLNITNTTLTTTGILDVRGTNLTLLNDNSKVITSSLFSTGGSFPDVEITVNNSNISITNTTIGNLVFSNTTSLPGTVRIGGGNTIRRLEFKATSVIRAGGNVIDTLILAPSKKHILFGANTINKLLQLNSADCSGLAELTTDDGSIATLNLTAATETDIRNVYVTNVTLAGSPALPLAIQGADGGGNTGWAFNTPAAGVTLYWVGGAGDWNDASHWSNTSGGAGGYCVPFSADDVVFDANSGFTPASNTVTTSSNTWCHNMTWTGTSNAPIFNESTSFTLQVWGSVVLDPAVTMNAELLMIGSQANTFTSNGSTLGAFRLTIQKTGTNGGITLTDDLINTNTFLRLNTGKLLLPGRTLNIYDFTSPAATRTMDITNANITVQNLWNMTGTGCTWIGNGAGSVITSQLSFGVLGLAYPNVVLTSGTGVFSITNASIGNLTFEHTSVTSTARIASGNTITRLEFKGAGNIVGSNTIGQLILAPTRNYTIGGTNTINQSLTFNNPACTGLGEIRGPGTLAFGTSATASLANVYLQDIKATGAGVIPITVTGADAGGNSGFNFTSTPGGNRYWVGGSGDWNDASHWSMTSGGTPGACIPTFSNDVFFDANSFTSSGKTVTTTGNVYCRNLDWTGATNNPVLTESTTFAMEVWGDLILTPTVTMNAEVNMKGASNSSITMNGNTLGDLDFIVDKPGGGISFNGTINNAQTRIQLNKGAVDLSGKTVNMDGFDDLGTTYPTSVNISNSTLSTAWRYTGAAKNLNAAGSVLNARFYMVNGGTYNVVNVATGNNNIIAVSNTTVKNLTFTLAVSNSDAFIGAANRIERLEFKGRGLIGGNNNVLDTLILAPGFLYLFASGTNTTINNALYGSGTPCNLTELTSTLATSNATITKTNGGVTLDYARIKMITAVGTSPFEAQSHSIDQGGNVNWNIAPYNNSVPILGLGPDIAIHEVEFPYTLKTDGFFASPQAQYLWNDGSTGRELVVAVPGTYRVKVSFADGCTINDEIVVAMSHTLPIVLESFTARANGCQPALQWKVSQAVSFRQFVVERSLGNEPFQPIATIAYEALKTQYAYTDAPAAANGNIRYRLKLVDLDGRYEYSQALGVKTSCTQQGVTVLPTVTQQEVHVRFTSGFERSRIQLTTATGQVLQTIIPRRQQVTLQLAGLPAGTYLVLVEQPGGRTVHKIVKQ